MNLSPQKRRALIIFGAITLLVGIALWSMLIGPAQERLSQKIKTKSELTRTLASKKEVVQRAEKIAPELQKAFSELRAIENKMVSGDPFLWIIKTTGAFEVPNRLEIAKADPPQPAESNLGNNVTYKALSFAFTGTATFHDLGLFLSRFENAHPYIRIQRLDMEVAGPPALYEEKLSFLVEVRVLVKPSNVSAASPPVS